jgi:hypothetical protein
MKTYRFVMTTHHDVFAATLEEAVETFHELRRQGLSPKLDVVTRIEVENEKGDFIAVDRPLRGGDLDARWEAPPLH